MPAYRDFRKLLAGDHESGGGEQGKAQGQRQNNPPRPGPFEYFLKG